MPLDEQQSLTLLRDCQTDLSGALDSLGGKNYPGLHEAYLFYRAVHINRLVAGYLILRDSGCLPASKQLIRPMIEALFQLEAVRANPPLVFHIAYTEYDEEKRMIASFGTPQDIQSALASLDANWAAFVGSYHLKYGGQAPAQERIGAAKLAKAGGLTDYYNTHYLLYCKFTHAALRATTGGFDETDIHDNPAMTFCAFQALRALLTLGATSPNIASLAKRLNA